MKRLSDAEVGGADDTAAMSKSLQSLDTVYASIINDVITLIVIIIIIIIIISIHWRAKCPCR